MWWTPRLDTLVVNPPIKRPRVHRIVLRGLLFVQQTFVFHLRGNNKVKGVNPTWNLTLFLLFLEKSFFRRVFQLSYPRLKLLLFWVMSSNWPRGRFDLLKDLVTLEPQARFEHVVSFPTVFLNFSCWLISIRSLIPLDLSDLTVLLRTQKQNVNKRVFLK